ncbi:hypothetical protein NCAS_0G04230 [Naumovozyma castellii]|uniref:Uncharacterized protein n=1 Tax=Naumovozyma castellii TaxID=27288 RepID=G0VHK3_NAUCA|nr:hypothetical protein NCAS_0G04230 [Naumovozyma castellii CBS 4309]CCC71310.1 hypothetical protein NCAS_0G04230 [Naumovozyma castellii CBS 4309]
MFLKKNSEYSVNGRKFEELDVTPFKSHEFQTILSYAIIIWGLSVMKFALLISDIYTCIKLLAFNTWSNNYIKPFLPFNVSKWLFSACIIFSIILLLYDIICGLRVYKRQIITNCYMNNFARTFYCLLNYSVFCVLDRITPNGRFQKIAFFTFFELKNCFRLVLTDSPRQVINGLTLWSVLIAVNDEGGNSDNLKNLESFHGLINKIRRIAQSNHEEAVILSFMLFSFIIWTFFILKFFTALSCSFYVYKRLSVEYKVTGGLKEYIRMTVNYNIDYLMESQNLLLNGTVSGVTNKPIMGVFSLNSLERHHSFLESIYPDDISAKTIMRPKRLTSMIIPDDSLGYVTYLKKSAILNGDLLKAPKRTSVDTLPSYYNFDGSSDSIFVDRNTWKPSHIFTPQKAFFRDHK